MNSTEIPTGISEQKRRIGNSLAMLVKRQQEETASLKSCCAKIFESSKPKEIFDRFLTHFRETPKFTRISNFLTGRNLGRRNENGAFWEHSLAGALFQELAFLWASGNLPSENLVLLSPKRTLQFYMALFPEAGLQDNLFGLDSLLRISVPDGLIVKVVNDQSQLRPPIWRIVEVVEYTLANRQNYFDDKIKAAQGSQRRFPFLFGKARVAFVTPKFITDQTIPRQVIKAGAQIYELPFNHSQFGNFVGKFVNNLYSIKSNH